MTSDLGKKKTYSSPDVVCRGSLNDVVAAGFYYTTSDGTEISPGQTGGVAPTPSVS